MASVAISALPAVVTPGTADVFPVVQGGTTKKLSMSIAFSIPPPIGASTPNTGAFTTLTASGTIVGSSSVQGASFIVGASGPTITTGAGVPATTTPKGSIYFRTGGGVGTTLYVSQGGGTWNPVAGV